MRSRIFLSMLLVIMYNSQSWSQVPGYMGKKLYVNYDLNFFPALRSHTYNETDLNRDKPAHGMNYRHSAEVDYVISRTNAIGISYGYFRSRYYYVTPGDTEMYPSVKGNNIGLNYTIFIKKKGAVAPLGSYVKLTAELIKNTITTDLDLVPRTYTGKTLKAFSVTIGDQKIYYNRLIIDIGAQFGYVEGLLNVLPAYDIQWYAQRRIMFHYVMNVHARVGFLIL